MRDSELRRPGHRVWHRQNRVRRKPAALVRRQRRSVPGGETETILLPGEKNTGKNGGVLS